ncbi:MAG: Gx transporter family protein, partial [Lachnospiraceae bacterium]|nr:Gx transporter family protein [Lachnospiraceae bacterium]
MTNAKKVAYCAMFTALSMIFSYIEALIPLSVGIPGIKLGLSNLVVVSGLYFLPVGWVFLVLVLKVTLVSFLFGNLSMLLYSM